MVSLLSRRRHQSAEGARNSWDGDFILTQQRLTMIVASLLHIISTEVNLRRED